MRNEPRRTRGPAPATLLWPAAALLVTCCLAGCGDARPVAGSDPAPTSRETLDPAAERAATEGAELVLGYHWDTLEDDLDEARAVLTPQYRDELERLWVVIEENAPAEEVSVEVDVVGSALVAGDEQSATFLLFLDRDTTTGTADARPTTYEDAVALTVVPDPAGSSAWLVDDITTAPDLLPAPDPGTPAAVAQEFVAADPPGGATGSSYEPFAAGTVTEPGGGDGETVHVLVAGTVTAGDAQGATSVLRRLRIAVVRDGDTWRVDDVVPVG